MSGSLGCLSLDQELREIEEALVIPLPPNRYCAYSGCKTVLAHQVSLEIMAGPSETVWGKTRLQTEHSARCTAIRSFTLSIFACISAGSLLAERSSLCFKTAANSSARAFISGQGEIVIAISPFSLQFRQTMSLVEKSGEGLNYEVLCLAWKKWPKAWAQSSCMPAH
jgi:hypothetical protein